MRKVPMPVAGTATDEPSKLTGQSSPEKRDVWTMCARNNKGKSKKMRVLDSLRGGDPQVQAPRIK